MKIDDENMFILMLTPLLRSFKHFKDVLLYSTKVTITMDEVHMVVKSERISMMKILEVNDSDQGLSISKEWSESIRESKSRGFDKEIYS